METDTKLKSTDWITQDKDYIDLLTGMSIVLREMNTSSERTNYKSFIREEYCETIESKLKDINHIEIAKHMTWIRYIRYWRETAPLLQLRKSKQNTPPILKDVFIARLS